MKMVLKDVLDYNTLFKNLIDRTSISGALKFRFLTALKQFEPVVENFNKVKNDLITKYGESREDGSIGIFEPDRANFKDDIEYKEALNHYDESMETYRSELDKVLAESVNVEFTKFGSDIMEANIPSDALLLIYDLIEM